MSVMNELLLQAYVREVLNEKLYFHGFGKNKKPKKKERSVLSRIKSAITGHGAADKFFDEWVRDQELYGIEVDSDKNLFDRIKNYVREKYEIAYQRIGDNQSKIDTVMRRAINNKFRKELSTLRDKFEDLENENP